MEAILNTVSTIFRERYGATLKVNTDFSSKEQKPHFLSRWQNSFVYSRTLRQVSFPIFNSKRELQAIAVASPVNNKDAIMFDEMSQFLQLTISEHLELAEIKELKVRTQEAIELAHTDTQKVIELKTKRRPTTEPMQIRHTRPEREADITPIWISGANEDFNAHIAFSVHDWIANWAFINAKEIPDLVWQDPHAWTNFPQVTLFVPNIATLSEAKLDILKNNLAQLKKVKGPKPLLIISSPLEVSPELDELKKNFKHYKSNKNVTARVQAHFLLYHHKKETPWTHQCKDTDGIYFFPFSPGPEQLH